MVESGEGIRIVAIPGSVRPGNYTSRVLDLALDELRSLPEVSVEVFDPAEMDLPLPGREAATSDGEILRQAVTGATGVILATPEYHGSVSSVMKLVIENLGFPSVLAGKPVALLGVAAGRIGAIKSLEQLRSICSHVGAIVLPGPVSVANVRAAFDADGKIVDEAVEKQVRGVPIGLLHYIDDNICPRFTLEQMVRGETGSDAGSFSG